MSQRIPLTRGLFATVDDADWARLRAYRWYAHNCRGKMYADTRLSGRRRPHVYMHRLILNAAPGMVTDHINGDTLDNRRENLRACTRGQNMWNVAWRRAGSSRFTGTTRRGARWRAAISVGGRTFYVGTFDREVDAAIAYDAHCLAGRGEFARPNFGAVLPPATLRGLLRESGGRFFTCCFIKRTDGSERIMLCRTGVSPKPGPAIINITETHDLVSVWDVKKRAFRFISVEGILWIRLNKTYIRPLRRADLAAGPCLDAARRLSALTAGGTLKSKRQGLLFARTAG